MSKPITILSANALEAIAQNCRNVLMSDKNVALSYKIVPLCDKYDHYSTRGKKIEAQAKGHNSQFSMCKGSLQM